MDHGPLSILIKSFETIFLLFFTSFPNEILQLNNSGDEAPENNANSKNYWISNVQHIHAPHTFILHSPLIAHSDVERFEQFHFSNRIWIYIQFWNKPPAISNNKEGAKWNGMIAMLNDLECVLKTNIDDDLWFISAIRKSEHSIFNRNKFKTFVLHTHTHTHTSYTYSRTFNILPYIVHRVRYTFTGWLGRMDVHAHLQWIKLPEKCIVVTSQCTGITM